MAAAVDRMHRSAEVVVAAGRPQFVVVKLVERTRFVAVVIVTVVVVAGIVLVG